MLEPRATRDTVRSVCGSDTYVTGSSSEDLCETRFGASQGANQPGRDALDGLGVPDVSRAGSAPGVIGALGGALGVVLAQVVLRRHRRHRACVNNIIDKIVYSFAELVRALRRSRARSD